MSSLDAQLTRRYAQTEATLLTQGLLRTDAGAVPDDPDRLAQNFLRIALFDEYSEIGGAIVAREQSSTLRRWDSPVRIGVRFGASVPDAERTRDSATINALATRLNTVSGHPIQVTDQDPNLEVFVVSESERRALAPDLKNAIPGISDPVIRQITGLPDSIFCIVVAFSDQRMPSVYLKAVAVVRAELPPLMRRSCYHEEITQGLGLANDSPQARPSLFNDDKEFALLTAQDEFMLKILYDPRLKPGMTLPEAEPIAQQIARDLLPPRGAAVTPPPRQDEPNQSQET